MALVDPVLAVVQYFAQPWDLVKITCSTLLITVEKILWSLTRTVNLKESNSPRVGFGHIYFLEENLLHVTAYLWYIIFRVVAKSSPCTLSPYERLKTMENYELITLKSCRGCLQEVLLLGILQRLWLMKGGCLREVVAR